MRPSQESDRTAKESEYPVSLLLSMLNLYSPSGNENQVATFLESELRKKGLSTRRDVAVNVIGEIGTGRARILLCGHKATGPGRLPRELKDNHAYRRRAVHAKSSRTPT